jgi:uncharacterized damage-inducible protein DinB
MQRFIDASRAFLMDEYLPKIRVAVAPLNDDEIWWRPHADSNSIGNLLMHLEGNARQWLLGGVGKMPGMRDRDSEFATTNGATKMELVDRLAATIHDIDGMFSRLTVAELDEPRLIQGASTNVFDAIYHVVEHFSGHTGQIILLAKWLAPGAVKLYDASSTSFTPLWTPEPRRR